jgi:hypothetical protein
MFNENFIFYILMKYLHLQHTKIQDNIPRNTKQKQIKKKILKKNEKLT